MTSWDLINRVVSYLSDKTAFSKAQLTIFKAVRRFRIPMNASRTGNSSCIVSSCSSFGLGLLCGSTGLVCSGTGSLLFLQHGRLSSWMREIHTHRWYHVYRCLFLGICIVRSVNAFKGCDFTARWLSCWNIVVWLLEACMSEWNLQDLDALWTYENELL